jgi:hypothetical protein
MVKSSRYFGGLRKHLMQSGDAASSRRSGVGHRSRGELERCPKKAPAEFRRSSSWLLSF